MRFAFMVPVAATKSVVAVKDFGNVYNNDGFYMMIWYLATDRRTVYGLY